MIKKTKIFLCTFLVVISLTISTPNTTSAGGGGGGAVIVATLIGIELFAKHFQPGNEFVLQGKDIPQIINAAVFTYYFGRVWLNPTVDSVWAITLYTQEMRFLLALQYYMSMYRYLIAKQEITRALTPPASIGHPNSLTNLAAIEVLTQYDLASGGEVRKKIRQYQQMQNIFALLNLIIMYNPYSTNFLFQRGNTLGTNLGFVPSLASSEDINLVIISQLVNNYINLIASTTSTANLFQLTQNTAVIAIAIMQYLILTRMLITESY